MAFTDFSAGGLSRRNILKGGACLAGGTALASMPFGSALFAHDVSEAWPTVAAEVDRYLKEKKVATMIATFGWKQDDHVHSVGGGTLSLAGSIKADVDSLYRIYSMTKPITGIMAMQLVSEGKIALDQPLSDILPAFAEMQVQKEYDGAITEDNLEPARNPITIRQNAGKLARLIVRTTPLGAREHTLDEIYQIAWAAALTEAGGAILLLFGFAVRWISIPLIVTMLVAIFAVHWPYGWQAIADPSAPFANERVLAAAEKLERARSILREHGNYDWLTGSGKFVVLNNGIEFAATYFIMLLTLFFIGGGRYISADYWLNKHLTKV